MVMNDIPECQYTIAEGGVGDGRGYWPEQEIGGGVKNDTIFNTPLLQ